MRDVLIAVRLEGTILQRVAPVIRVANDQRRKVSVLAKQVIAE